MKRNRLLWLLLSLGFISIVAWLLLPPYSKLIPPEERTTEKPVAQDTRAKIAASGNAEDRSRSTPAEDGPKTNPQSRVAIWQKEFRQWRTPILFYGKVLDQDGQPIEGVEVKYHGVSISEDLTKDEYPSGITFSDEAGIFKIDGIRGASASFELAHKDYYPANENPPSYRYLEHLEQNDVADTPEKAIVFKMIHKGQPVPLVHRRVGADVPVGSGSGVVKFFGKEDNQLVGTLQMEAWGDTPKNWSPQPYNWSARLTIPDGGLVEATNYFAFIAPESGYQQSVEINMSKEQPGWSDSVDKWFFIKLPSGYARMRIYMRAKTPLFASLEYYYNPDGSRNLEAEK